MVSCFISRLVILIFGTLYPAYASYKAVRTKNVREYVKWMMYWIVFALFTCAETFTDLFLSFWFPFYYEIKIITVIYLLSPATKGSSILYRRFVHPVLTKREQEIDEYIAKAKEQGYHTMLNLGSKGVTYATSLIMQTAIKSGGGLVNHLRRSYSLSDLNEETNLRRRNEETADDTDGSYDPRVIRRNFVQSPRRTIASPDQAGLIFQEVDRCQGPEEEVYYRQIPSSEEISSGYSSGDPLYYPPQRSKGDNLVRTASLGPSSHIRTRAATRNGLPKRSTLSEGGSSWSAVESQGTQIETDRHFSFPLSHSVSFPFPFTPVHHGLGLAEYQNLFGNLTQNQMFAFINHPSYPQFLSTKTFEPESNSGEVLENKTNSKSVVILEESSENSEVRTEQKIDDPNFVVSETNGEKPLKDEVVGEAVKNKVDKVDENFGNVDYPSGGLETKEKAIQERSGKYNKKPAPTPPSDENVSKVLLTPDDDETEFYTPNSSPKLTRKLITAEVQNGNNCTNEDKTGDLLEVPKKTKSKNKKGDFNISKKLHMPKMSFSFWHQKGGKQGSGSETSSIASTEVPTKSEGSDLEYFIPLKDDDSRTDENSGKEEIKD